MARRLITTTTIPASSYDLTDLPTVKDELQITLSDTSKDAWLGRAITQVTASVMQYCNRVFQVETVQDAFYPTAGAYPYSNFSGSQPLQLSRWPVLGLSFTATVTNDSPANGATLYAADSRIIAGMPVSIPLDAGEFVASVALTFRGDVPTLAAPLSVDVSAGTVVTYGPIVTITDTSGNVTYLTAGTDYLIDQDRGWLIRMNAATGRPVAWESSNISVAYQAGFPTIPADVVDACLRLITGRFQGRGRDPYLKSQTQPGLGDQTYWVGNLPGVAGAMTQEVEDLLDNYRLPVVG